jgi:flagellar protein FlaG
MALQVSSVQTASPAPHEGSRHNPVSAETVAPKPSAKEPVDLKTVIRDIQRVSDAFNRHLTFTLNEKLGQVVVKVVDNDTDKVVREIPPKELQRVYERIREVMGVLFDKSA